MYDTFDNAYCIDTAMNYVIVFICTLTSKRRSKYVYTIEVVSVVVVLVQYAVSSVLATLLPSLPIKISTFKRRNRKCTWKCKYSGQKLSEKKKKKKKKKDRYDVR